MDILGCALHQFDDAKSKLLVYVKSESSESSFYYVNVVDKTCTCLSYQKSSKKNSSFLCKHLKHLGFYQSPVQFSFEYEELL